MRIGSFLLVMPIILMGCSGQSGQGFDEYRVPSASIEEQERLERLQRTQPPE